ncbi:MAG: flagellar hook-associated protein FlgK [Bacillus sp. (in: firmicutes)]
MASTFFGLETAKRGLAAQQSALYTTGHNIANANTDGYSRQRVNLTTTTPYEAPGMNRSGIIGQIGTGVQAESVQRIRDSFADLQYRTQNNKLGYYGAISESLTKMEEVMNEPSDSGLQATMNEFWNALQTLSANPENSGARSVVASAGQMVADTYNYYYNSLTSIQQDIGDQIDVTIQEINTIIDNINKLNKQISEVEPHGMLPNDLYDHRDMLVDQLSSLVNIKVTKQKPDEYGLAKADAEGLYNIELVDEAGASYDPPVKLLEVTGKGLGDVQYFSVSIKDDTGNYISVESVTVGSEEISNMNFSGELAGLIKSYGYMDGTNEKGYYPDMLKKLNTMAKAFADEFNNIHQSGKTNDGNAGVSFFEGADETDGQYAKHIKVNADITNNSSLVVTGETSDAGDNLIAQKLANLKTKSFTEYETFAGANSKPDMLSGNLDSFYSGIIGSLGVDSQSVQKNLANTETIIDSVQQRRESTSSVSLDEEMVNMITFQHAYNASSRMITVVDEMLDKIINGMGRVGL